MSVWMAAPLGLFCAYALVVAGAFALTVVYVLLSCFKAMQLSWPAWMVKPEAFLEHFIEQMERDAWYKNLRSVWTSPFTIVLTCVEVFFALRDEVIVRYHAVRYFVKHPDVRARYLRRKRAQRARKNATK
ncbi:MAG TPA: hypothetical protein VKX46_03700 [Ktedonobacteraceae bacterium]|nr:hypothetical protein [Ktedonobacteraceae bacterium]